jgi:XTP/dITP diphosphohydrolase
MTEVVLASRNRGKLAELQAVLAPLNWRLRTASEFDDETPEETAPTYVENALIKARHAARVSGLPALADDSGLEVAALRGSPGVRSARYAGESAGDEDNNRKLLAALQDVAASGRAARYAAVLVFLRHAEDPSPLIAQAYWSGSILLQARGSGGFGYDPLFLVPEFHCSAAELPAEVKNRISHRAQAARQLYALIRDAA